MNRLKQITSAHKLSDVIKMGMQDSQSANTSTVEKQMRILLAIDVQNDFVDEDGSLAVDGAKEDIARLNQWIYRNIDKVDTIVCSLDTHQINQIFHPAWWVNPQGETPDPFTIITLESVEKGIWLPKNGDLEYAKIYLSALIEKGYKELCIWPYHCLEGSYGYQLESRFLNMLYYHSAYHSTRPQLIKKGEDSNSEMYGIIKAEYDPDNKVNQAILNIVKDADEVYIAGEASSHCVLASINQIVEYFKNEPNITSKIIVLEDCMSPIQGFEETTKIAFKTLRDQYGVQFKNSQDVRL